MMRKILSILGASALFMNAALAMPTDMRISDGASNISNFSFNPQSGSVIDVKGNAEISCENFNIDAGEKLTFNVNDGCVLTIDIKNKTDIKGNFNQSGSGAVKLINSKNVFIGEQANVDANNLTVKGDDLEFVRNAKFTVNEMQVIGNKIVNSANIKVQNNVIFTGKQSLLFDRAEVSGANVFSSCNGKFKLSESIINSTSGSIILGSIHDYTVKGDIITDEDNNINIDKCYLNSFNDMLISSYNIVLANSNLLAGKNIQVQAMLQNSWDLKESKQTTKYAVDNKAKMSNNTISLNNVMNVSGGMTLFDNNKISKGTANIFASEGLYDNNIMSATDENISVVNNNYLSENVSLNVNAGYVLADRMSYHRKGQFTHNTSNYSYGVNVFTAGEMKYYDNEVKAFDEVKAESVMSEPVLPVVKPIPVELPAVEIIDVYGTYAMGDNPNDNVAYAKEQAYKNAMQALLGRIGVYIESYSKVENSVLTRDEIQALSASFLKFKVNTTEPVIVSGIVTYRCHLVAEVDTKGIDFNKIIANKNK